MVAREEIETGGRDTNADARGQLDAQARLLQDAAAGNKTIRLEASGKDITSKIDLGSDLAATRTTRGPAGKGFEKSLDVSASDLEALCKEFTRQEREDGKGAIVTLYAIRPAPETRSLDDAEVIDQSRYGWQFLEQAITLWRLVDSARADAIEGIKDRVALAAGDEEVRFYPEDVRELVRLLSGIDDAIIAAGIVDQHWRVPPARLEELAKRVPAMDLTTERPLANKASALGEVMINAVSIRNFLSNAVDAGCVVVLG